MITVLADTYRQFWQRAVGNRFFQAIEIGPGSNIGNPITDHTAKCFATVCYVGQPLHNRFLVIKNDDTTCNFAGLESEKCIGYVFQFDTARYHVVQV